MGRVDARWIFIAPSVIIFDTITYADERVIRQDGVTIRVVPAWRWLLEAANR
jgi:hypothetical protein